MTFSLQLAVTGSCASIDYSASCCPPGANCQATDGNCFCNANCHVYGDCCDDVYCPESELIVHTFVSLNLIFLHIKTPVDVPMSVSQHVAMMRLIPGVVMSTLKITIVRVTSPVI